ncbi:rRNA methyltransferase 1, mitochondrial [Centropristis striata]|uniref:rRNA methyltransferase 1, mitochondrial n=1 Tax=Centropristis striata TaxID=184440 RepID=UPI0027DFD4C7|nr:rRNA methyltransferase 1, mitochondrial [Centropristis striata]
MWVFNVAQQHKLLLVWTRRLQKSASIPKPHHVSASLLSSEDSSFTPTAKRRRKAFDPSKPEKYERSVQTKAWKKEIPVIHRSSQRNWEEGRVSSELRRLSLDDFPEEKEKEKERMREQKSSLDRRDGQKSSLDRRDGQKSSLDRRDGQKSSLDRRDGQKSSLDRRDGQKSSLDRRDGQNYEVVFGIAPCILALTQGRRKAHKLFVKDSETSHRTSVLQVCEAAHRRGVQVQRVTKRDLDKMSPGGVHQGVCLKASPLSYLTETKDLAPSKGHAPLWLVLERVQDPMNLGAILRSAYFLGVDRVASSLRHSCPLTPVVSKASSGVMEVLEVYGYEKLEDMLQVKLAQGWQVVGTVGAAAEEAGPPVTQCSDFQMTKPTVLLMGGEGEGLSQQLLSLCQTLLTIPPGRELSLGVESLNVSVATGILLHALLSSRSSHR